MPTLIISANSGADVASADDTFISGAAAEQSTNFGTATILRIRGGADETTRRTLLRFELSGILALLPAGAIINACRIKLWTHGNTGAGIPDMHVHRSNKAWVEAQATWLIYATATNWGTSGSSGAGVDLVGTIESSTGAMASLVGGSAQPDHTINTFEGNATMVAYIDDVVNGDEDETHVKFILSSSTNTTNRFCSSDNADDGFRPQLEIDYYVPGGIYLMLEQNLGM